MTPEDLSGWIEHYSETLATDDVIAIRDAVLDRITTSEALALLDHLLIPYIRQVVASARSSDVPDADATPASDDLAEPDTAPSPARPRPAAPSWKTAAIRLLLASTVAIDPDGGDTVLLGDSTARDLTRAACLRRGKADRLLTEAVRLEKLTALLDEHAAATVADLPAPVLEDLARSGSC